MKHLLLITFLTQPFINFGQGWNAVYSGLIEDVRDFETDTINHRLYFGGDIDSIGNQAATHLGVLDSTDIQPFAPGFNEHIDAVRLFNGDLWVSGDFDTAATGIPAGYIARLGLTGWSSPGGGMDGFVFAMQEFNGELYAAGQFTMAGGIAANNIARWNGTSWQPCGQGADYTINCLAVYNGELYAGGAFASAGGVTSSYIARWNGTSWSAVGTGTNNRVYALKVFNGKLYAGGGFTTAGGTVASLVASWDGNTWSAVGNGLSGSLAYVGALERYAGNLYAGGDFDLTGTTALNNMAVWNGTMWTDVNGGVYGGAGYVSALGVYRDELYVGGRFDSAGTVAAKNIARFTAIAPTASFSITDTLSQQPDSVACAGDCFQVQDFSLGGPSQITWSFPGGNATALAGKSVVVCYPNPGTYTITQFVSNYMGADTLIKTNLLTVYPTPMAMIVPDSATICPGDTISLDGLPNAGHSYQWLFNGSIISNATIAGYQAGTAGNYQLIVSYASGCTDTSAIAPVTYFSAPVPPVISRNVDTLFANTTTGNLQWLFNGVTIPGATGNYLIATQNGSYTVVLTDTNGCEAVTSYTYNFSGVEEYEHSLRIYPNPSAGKLMIENTTALPLTYFITTLTGQTVAKGISGVGVNEINLSHLSNGVYIFRTEFRSEKIILYR